MFRRLIRVGIVMSKLRDCGDESWGSYDLKMTTKGMKSYKGIAGDVLQCYKKRTWGVMWKVSARAPVRMTVGSERGR